MRNLIIALSLTLVASCGSLGQRASAQDMGFSLTGPQPVVVPQVGQELRPGITDAVPARMLVIGDSLSEGFGALLRQQVRARDMPIQVVSAGRNSTGLARRDFYDWPTQFARMAAEAPPDIVVAHFGANDMQAIIQPGLPRTALGSGDWDAVYTQQIEAILQTAAEAGAVVYLLGPATDSHTNLNNHLIRLNPLFEASAEAAGAIYFPLRPFTSGPNGQFAQNVVVNGQSVRLRTGDGSHFNGRGYQLVADRVLDDLLTRFPVLDRDPAVASEVASASEASLFRLQ